MEQTLSFENLPAIHKYSKLFELRVQGFEGYENVLIDSKLLAIRSEIKKVIASSLLNFFEKHFQETDYEIKITCKLEDILWKKVFYIPLNLFKQSVKSSDWSSDEVNTVKEHLEEGFSFYIDLMGQYSKTVEIVKDDIILTNLSRAFSHCLSCLGDLSRYYALDLNKKHDVSISANCLPTNYYHQLLQFNPSADLTLTNVGVVYNDWQQKPLTASLHFVAAMATKKSSSRFASVKLNDLLKAYHSQFNSQEKCSENAFVKSVLNAIYCFQTGEMSAEYVNTVCIKLLSDLNSLLDCEHFTGHTLLHSSALLVESYKHTSLDGRKPTQARLLASCLIAMITQYYKKIHQLICSQHSETFFNDFIMGSKEGDAPKSPVDTESKDKSSPPVSEGEADDRPGLLTGQNGNLKKKTKRRTVRRRRKIASMLPEDSDDDDDDEDDCVSEDESTSSLSDSDSNLSDFDRTLSDNDSSLSEIGGNVSDDVILESESDEENCEEIHQPQHLLPADQLINILADADKSCEGLFASICLLTKWLYQTTIEKNAFPWVNDANLIKFYEGLHQLNVITNNNLVGSIKVQSNDLSKFLKLLRSKQSSWSDFALSNDKFSLPNDDKFPSVLSAANSKQSEQVLPEIVCNNLQEIISPLIELHKLEQEENLLVKLLEKDEILLYSIRFKSYLMKLSEFDDCPLLYDQSSGTIKIDSTRGVDRVDEDNLNEKSSSKYRDHNEHRGGKSWQKQHQVEDNKKMKSHAEVWFIESSRHCNKEQSILLLTVQLYQLISLFLRGL